LFNYRQAYCVYYASSEVLMLRSVGVPARMAVGFSQGEPEGNKFVVRRFNSHAWPEVYFPGIGWVEFEPTAGQAPLSRPLPPQDAANADSANPLDGLRNGDNPFAGREQVELPPDVTIPPETSPFSAALYLLPLLTLVAALTILLSRRYALPERLPVFLRATIERSGIEVPPWIARWEKWVRLSPIERAFESVNFGLRQLDQPAQIHITPIERADRLTRLLPDKSDQIKVLLDEHQTSLYTSRTADVTQARRAALEIRRQVIIERARRLLFGSPPR
jgi:hypothetical protein